MKNKTRVSFFSDDNRNGDWKQGEVGYIDGYVRGGDDIPYAVVIKENGYLVMTPLHQLIAILKTE